MYGRLKHLVSPLFIFFLVLLIVNDFFLKAAFHNAVTGKLSDFSGLFIFPIFWSAIFPRHKLSVFITTAVLFVFWKSNYSSGIIQFLKPYFSIARTVDPTDLIALFMLLFAWLHIKRVSRPTIGSTLKTRLTAYFIGAIAIFSFCATSQPRYIQFFEQPQYVLLKNPTIRYFNAHDELKFYKRDSLLAVKINYLYIRRPKREDDYSKNRSVEHLDLTVLRLLADSASLIPPGKISMLTLNTDQGTDSLRFNGGRLDGRFTRTKGGKTIIEGFYKMGLEDSIWTIRDTIGGDQIIQAFVNGETTQIKRYSGGKLKSTSTINTRADSIFNTYVQLAVLILCMAGLGYFLYINYRKARPEYLKLRLLWGLLLCFVAPFFVWLFYIGILLLLMNYNQDIFETIAAGIFIFITVCPLMFVIVFLIKLRRPIDIFLYCLLFSLVCSAWTTYTTIEALSN
ncbi:hypothetical protein [Sphingobacterium sp.]|uniref:hypothetical protein n=1 Tax=Sphingobacterium sp. TaxID=341027 RepID=UPI0031E16DAF